MTSRVLSLWLPHLATDRIRRGRPAATSPQPEFSKSASPRSALPKSAASTPGSAPKAPLATFLQVRGQLQLAALCPGARRAGLAPGMPLADARAMVPALRTARHEPRADRRLLTKLMLWCERFTPWTALDASHEGMPGGALWLDITGCAHLFGGEARLRADLLERLARQGFTARAAIADHPGAAWAIARHGPLPRGEEGEGEGWILPVGGARVGLARLPVAGLRLTAEQAAMLARLGIERIEQLYALPRKSLAARFGDGLVRRLDQALGLIDEPISPHAPLPAHRAQLIFAEPIIQPEALAALTERLLQQLCVGLEAAGLGARRLTLALYRVDGGSTSLSIGTSRPCRDVARLLRLFAERFERVDPGFGIERAILEAVEIEPLLPETIAWRGLGIEEVQPMRDLAPLVDRLSNRLGEDAVTRLVPRASHLPERAQQQVPAFSRAATALELEPAPLAEPETPPRPLRLLRQPEPIEAIAALPDEPPMLFRWRQQLHKIVRARGPERIAPEWWRMPEAETASHAGQAALTRDYFAVEDADGGRFWLFREGLYTTSPVRLPRWYLHGLFA
jgi:protein ImuB